METRGLEPFFNRTQTNTVATGSREGRTRAHTPSLSSAEQKMINKKFTPGNAPLEFYEGSGSVRREQPSSRGANIDITV